MTVKLELNFNDRIGIVADISNSIADHDLNILRMEVERKDRVARVFVELEKKDDPINTDTLMHIFSGIASFVSIRLTDTLPQEEKANRFGVVLDNISDGVLSIDRNGTITTINKMICRIFDSRAEDLIGRNLKRLPLPDYPLLRSLEGETIQNVKQSIQTATGRYQYLSTCRPLRDTSNRIIGAVEIAKDMMEIKKMARSISNPSQIGFSDIIGKNEIMIRAIDVAQLIAPNDVTISIYGESGTGKELFARAIHLASKRPGPFIPVNCGALPEQLLESELFGYVGGSFTGGKKDGKPGLFEIADTGTVFLDEIGEMPLGSQVKLLRVIQEKAVRRIGGDREIPVRARIITASNRDLLRLVKEAKFRQDLYYRISVLPIHIPPLKHRGDDIPLLVEHFLFQLASRLDKETPVLTPSAMDKLIRHDWPGNVRELKNVVERAAILSEGPSITVDKILFSHELSQMSASAAPSPFSGQGRHETSLKERVGEYETREILDVYNRTKSIRKAARALQISHPALIQKMRKYKIITTKTATTDNG